MGEKANKKLAMTPAEDLLDLDILQEDVITDSFYAYQYTKRQNVLRVAAESVNWQKRGARINAISSGIVMTSLALDELNGPRGEGYRKMFDSMIIKRLATPDQIGELGEFLLSDKAAFITGSDILIDGGISAQ
ncbi:SDR family oxidoreductase [Lactobacillus taiwanensis]|uniref:SDR family oxidoreductase n=1 Tax=Lactobacillus taiwanensis TaxID=508451 RepID=UPI0025A994B0|nr:SDR family oxidoreductase [Lactobacillus taiwanensis]